MGNILGCRFIYFLKMAIPSKTAYSLNESYDCPKGQFGQVRPSARAVSYLNIQFEEKNRKKENTVESDFIPLTPSHSKIRKKLLDFFM